MKPPIILIADDDPNIRHLMRVALEGGDFSVIETEDGCEALEVFERTQPDLLLLDVMMPGMTGFEVCSKIRAHDTGRNVPIVIATGLDDMESIDAAYDAGATDFITKPINWRILCHRIQYILRASEAEIEAAKSHARLLDAIESFPAGFQLYDSDGHLVLFNKTFVEDNPLVADIAHDSPLREHIHKLLAPTGNFASQEAAQCDDHAEPSNERSDTVRRFEQQRDDSGWRQTIERETSDGGRVILTTDITELKEREEALQVAKEGAEAANTAKSEFLAKMSHELRTPLNGVIGLSEIVKSETLGPIGNKQYVEFVSDIYDSGRHLLGLVNQLLDMAKIEAGKIEYTESHISIADLVADVTRLLNVLTTNAEIRLSVVMPQSLPMLVGDSHLLRQIFLNILSNAIKFTPKDGRVEVSATADISGGLVCKISDTGIGIAEEDIETVLSPFAQGNNGLNREYEGTGLGLAISKSLMDLHDSELKLESQIGIGTTVTLTFPKSRVSHRKLSAA